MWHNNIDYKIIVLCCNTRRKHGHWEVVSAEYIYLYWIYSANNSGIYGSWRVSVRPSGAGLGKTCVSWIYIFVLDIFCQHLGDIWQLEGVCAPFGRWAGKQKISMVSNCTRCQICAKCQIGVELSSCPPCLFYVKLSTVSNCPGIGVEVGKKSFML